jgi:hypothetical protein
MNLTTLWRSLLHEVFFHTTRGITRRDSSRHCCGASLCAVNFNSRPVFVSMGVNTIQLVPTGGSGNYTFTYTRMPPKYRVCAL